jgi:hypothetical protein
VDRDGARLAAADQLQFAFNAADPGNANLLPATRRIVSATGYDSATQYLDPYPIIVSNGTTIERTEILAMQTADGTWVDLNVNGFNWVWLPISPPS